MATSTRGARPRVDARLLVIAILLAVPGLLLAQTRPDDDLLPGVLMPLRLNMPSDSELRAVGATLADARTFAAHLRAIADVVRLAPGYNPVPAGCDVDISGEVGIVVNQTTNKIRRFRGSLLIGCLPFDVEIRDGKKVRGGHGETRFFSISVNRPTALVRGRSWLDAAGEMYTQPEATGDFAGMPTYSRVNEYALGSLQSPAIVISRPGRPLFRPVGRERALKAFIADAEKGRALMPENLELAKRMLADLTPEQRAEPACYYSLGRLARNAVSAFPGIRESGITPVGVKDCIPIVQLNSGVLNNDLPPTAIQLITVTSYDDIVAAVDELRKNAGRKIFYYEPTVTALRRMDWQKLVAMLDQP